MDIGFIGLGNMGRAMTRCLIKGGHRLAVYNRTRAKAHQLAGDGAVVVERPAGACHGDAVIPMLADDPAVDGVALGDEGVLASLRRITHVLIAATLRGPIFGRPHAAAAGQPFVIAAGAGKVVGRCQVLFDARGRRYLPLTKSRLQPISSG